VIFLFSRTVVTLANVIVLFLGGRKCDVVGMYILYACVYSLGGKQLLEYDWHEASL